jgi:hypothetical protein
MTFETYWSIIDKKTNSIVTKEELKYYCDVAYGQGQAQAYSELIDNGDFAHSNT